MEGLIYWLNRLNTLCSFLHGVAGTSSSETLDKGSIQAKPNSQVEQSKPEQNPPSKRTSMFDLPDLPLDGGSV